VQNYPISPRPLDQHPVVQIRVYTVCTEDEFALDPLPSWTSPYWVAYARLGHTCSRNK